MFFVAALALKNLKIKKISDKIKKEKERKEK